jgi:hypothetical protein
LTILDKVLTRLEANGFACNPSKCEWGVKETDWLGYWLLITPVGIKPWNKKVQAILKMEAPNNVTQVRSFIGAVSYYRDMWPHRSHVLAPLTEITGKNKFVWTDRQRKALDEMKALVASDASYPNHNLPFDIETDANDYQLGAIIKQKGVPVAYYSRKLNAAQRNYSPIEKELLSVVETLREFRSMLLGAEIHVYSDYKNLSHPLSAYASQRVLGWHLFLEDYSPTFHYIPGPENLLADALSRVPRTDSREEENVVGPTSSTSVNHSIAVDDNDLLECFLMHPQFNVANEYPLNYAVIARFQQADHLFLQARNTRPDLYPIQAFSGIQLICYLAKPTDPWKIVIPDAMLDKFILWYHEVLPHAGTSRLEDSIKVHFYHPRLRQCIAVIVGTCDACQKYKLPGRGVGELPPREADFAPWNAVAVDLIGPWKIQIPGQELVFNARSSLVFT